MRVLSAYAEPIAEAYDLGSVLEFTGPVARGQQGEVWRLQTDRGDLGGEALLLRVRRGGRATGG